MKSLNLIVSAVLCLLTAYTVMAQDISVTGRVCDENDEPLIGAGVIVSGQNNGVVTDIDGKFSLTVPRGTILEFSYLGYETQSVPATAGSPMKIIMHEATNIMDEVVVVGYGVQKKINLTGSVVQISGDRISDRTTPNVMASLQGELPGVVVTQ